MDGQQRLHARMTTDRFFKYLGRINAVGIFLILAFLLITFLREYRQMQAWEEESDVRTPYGAKAPDNGIEGEEFETTGGGAVLYRTNSELQERLEIEARNISLTDRRTGKSRMILAEDSDQLVLCWEALAAPSESEKSAWIALTGTEQDYSDGMLDLHIGRFSDLEQRTLARRLRFVDSPRLIDNSTMTLIAWPENDRAEFWIVDLQMMSIVSKRPVALPARTVDELGEGSEDTAEDIVVGMN